MNAPIINVGGTDYNVKDEIARDLLISDIQIVDFSKITKNKLIMQDGSIIDAGSSFITDYIPVSEGEKISIKIPRVIACYDANYNFVSGSYESVNAPYDFTYYTVPSGASYARICAYNDYYYLFTANKGEALRPKEPYYKTEDIKTCRTGKQTTIGTNKVTMSSGDKWTFEKTNVVKNVKYYFSAKITALSELKIGHGNAGTNQPYLRITSTNAYVITDEGTETYEHGLTLSDYIVVIIDGKKTTADIIIDAGGSVYKIDDVYWYNGGNAEDFVECVTGTLSSCIFTVSYPDMAKDIWICGDSYMTITDESRWGYYLNQFGQIDNVLLHGYPGQGSVSAIPTLQKELNIAVPKKLIWCIGMNDGTDANGQPASFWLYGFENIKSLASKYGFELIIGTIPTVPSYNSEIRDSMIRSSGYRQIDFAKAVGADAQGNWYPGMLATDNVHPRIPGGIALYNAMLQAVPEIASDK